MLEIYKKDSNNPQYIETNYNSDLVLNPGSTGELLIVENTNSEFAFYQLLISPGNKAYTCNIYLNMSPLDSNNWGLLESITKQNTDPKILAYYSNGMFTAKNRIKIELINNEATQETFYYFISVAPRGLIFNRRN